MSTIKRRSMLAAGAGAAALATLAVRAQGAGQANGEVTKIDKAGGRVELRHGEIKALDMPPMKMMWRVRDAKMLDGLAVGDKVRFTGEKVGGQYTVTAIAKAS